MIGWQDARGVPVKSEEILAVSAAVLKDGQVLLVRRGRPPAKGLYAFPGGRVEAGETFEQALARELLEETGLVIETASPYQEILLNGDDGQQTFRLIVFRATVAAGAITAGDDASEAGWYAPEAITAMPLTDSTRAVIEELQHSTDS
ncbi:ADP-ribose pyrophosphatase YjhB, NUDIX family [Nitratireductor aquibiodomus]|uniref:ADP-ribose pyrophosphatase YjhB, NUDIX family n=1 Tax=Nitratireductor aquibiodomus TaxID=204799 RepID=A0A1H4NFZ0_9HYPH|nr:ADP-ribose pyrophosphatase YjhB, NUDIX family [Nitratireductor aquibiodomus]